MPAPEFAQKQVSVMAGVTDVVKHRSAAHLAGIVHNQIAEAQDSLRNAGRDGHILDLA